MIQLGMKVPEEDFEYLMEFKEENDLSKSEAGRELLSQGIENDSMEDEIERLQSQHKEKVEQLLQEHHGEKEQMRQEYEQEINDLETEIQRLNREKRKVLDQRNEHNQLIKAVERERSLEERKASAGMLTKIKWAFTGMPLDD